MTFESCLDVSCSVIKRDPTVRVALRYPLVKQLRDPQQLLLARFPHAYHYCTWSNAGRIRCRALLRGLGEMLLDTLEQCIDMLPYVLRVILFDDFLQCRSVVAAVTLDL